MDPMAVKVVRVRLRGTHLAVMRLNRQVTQGAKAAMAETAQFGLTAVERQISRTRPRPVAGGTYRAAWAVKKTSTGAILGNSSPQSVQVEVGREPGSPPPLDPLIEWVKQKRLVKPVRQRKRSRRGGRRDLGARSDKQREAANKRRYKSYLKRTNARSSQARQLAGRISKSIGRKGIEGRYVLAKTLPRTGRFLKRELARQTKQAIMSHQG